MGKQRRGYERERALDGEGTEPQPQSGATSAPGWLKNRVHLSSARWPLASGMLISQRNAPVPRLQAHRVHRAPQIILFHQPHPPAGSTGRPSPQGRFHSQTFSENASKWMVQKHWWYQKTQVEKKRKNSSQSSSFLFAFYEVCLLYQMISLENEVLEGFFCCCF